MTRPSMTEFRDSWSSKDCSWCTTRSCAKALLLFENLSICWEWPTNYLFDRWSLHCICTMSSTLSKLLEDLLLIIYSQYIMHINGNYRCCWVNQFQKVFLLGPVRCHCLIDGTWSVPNSSWPDQMGRNIWRHSYGVARGPILEDSYKCPEWNP